MSRDAGPGPRLHRHFTASFVYALDGAFRVRFGGTGWRRTRGVLVAPNTEQQMDAAGCRVVILQIDPETSAYNVAPRRGEGRRRAEAVRGGGLRVP